MTATKVIAAIKRLPVDEQAEVIRFAYKLDAQRQLTGRELSWLAARMIKTRNSAEKSLVREAIVHGFYGRKHHA